MGGELQRSLDESAGRESEATAVRPYAPADRAASAALLGDARPLDAPRSHAHLAGAGAVDSLALWLEPPAGVAEAYLGPVITPAPPKAGAFYELVLACANDASERGYERGYFTIKDAGLLRLLKRTFRIDPVATGWEPEGGSPSEWEVHVDLRDAVAQLHSVIQRLREASV